MWLAESGGGCIVSQPQRNRVGRHPLQFVAPFVELLAEFGQQAFAGYPSGIAVGSGLRLSTAAIPA